MEAANLAARRADLRSHGFVSSGAGSSLSHLAFMPHRSAFFPDREDGDRPPRSLPPVLIRMKEFSRRLPAPSRRPSIILLICLPTVDFPISGVRSVWGRCLFFQIFR
jgi:hypothetical protein